MEVICAGAKAEYFCAKGLDRFSVICPSGQLVAWEKAFSSLPVNRSSQRISLSRRSAKRPRARILGHLTAPELQITPFEQLSPKAEQKKPEPG
jgi:hypothetical protein